MIYIKQHNVSKIISYLDFIKKEYSEKHPNRRRVGRYKTLILSIFDDHDVLLPYSILDNVLDTMEINGDYVKTLMEELDISGLKVIDKPQFALVERCIFKSIDKIEFREISKKILERNGRCVEIDCYSCPLHFSNLTQECLDIYGIGCTKFGLSANRKVSDKGLVKALNRFLNLKEDGAL